MLVTQINWTPPVGWPDSVAVEMTPYFLSLGKWGLLSCHDSLLPLSWDLKTFSLQRARS